MKRALSTVLFAAALSAGCGDTTFQALTAPPPGKEATLNDHKREIRLSRGVALAFECFDEQSGGPCGHGTITTDDKGVASVLPAYLDDLTPQYRKGPQPRSAFVVVGKEVGETIINLDTDAGHAHFHVEVLE